MPFNARITIMESGGLAPIPARASSGHRIRALIKIALATSALASAGWGFYQTFRSSDDVRAGSRAPRAEAQASRQKSFFQTLIEADREALKGQATTRRPATFDGWRAFATALPEADRGRGQPLADASSLRSFFVSAGAGPEAPSRDRGWSLAFLNSTIVKAPAPARAPTPPAAARPHAPDHSVDRPSPPPAAARGAPAAATPGPAFGPPPAPPQAKGPPAGSGFREVRAAPLGNSAPMAIAPVAPDDLDFARAVLAASQSDVEYLPRAQAVLAEFARRYPHAHETAQLQARYASARNRHAASVAERTALARETPVAPVIFDPEAQRAIAACLSRIDGLIKVAAVNRPVSLTPDRRATLVAATVALPEGALGREAGLETMREAIAPALGACLAPLFDVGSVALIVTDGQDADLTRQRIDATPGAVFYERAAAGDPSKTSQQENRHRD